MASLISLRLCRGFRRSLALWRAPGRNSCPGLQMRSEKFIGDKSTQSISLCQFHSSAIAFGMKKKRKQPKVRTEEESESEDEREEEEEEDDEDELVKDYRMVDILVSSLRLDAVAKSGLGVPRGSVEQLLLEGKIRVNGQLCRKKATEMNVGVMLDFLIEPSADNPNFTSVRRIIIDKISDRADHHNRLTVTLKKWALLTVDDYKITSSSSETDKE